jgi:membrane fusion protein, macrolide-specific efflux system
MNKTSKILWVLAIGPLTLTLGCGPKIIEVSPQITDVVEWVYASGYVKPSEEYHISALTDGVLTDLYIQEGDTVQYDQLVGLIDNVSMEIDRTESDALLNRTEQQSRADAPKLRQLKLEYDNKRSALNRDSIEYIAAMNLMERDAISQTEFNKARSNYEMAKSQCLSASQRYAETISEFEKDLISLRSNAQKSHVKSNEMNIKSVMKGCVYELYKKKGDFVKKGDIIAKVGAIHSFLIRANVEEAQIERIQLNQEVVIRPNMNQKMEFAGRVLKILPAFNEEDQTYEIDIAFTGSEVHMISGAQVQCNIRVGLLKQAMIVPSESVSYDGTVMLKDSANPHLVLIGSRSAESFVISAGLKSDDIIQYIAP